LRDEKFISFVLFSQDPKPCLNFNIPKVAYFARARGSGKEVTD